MQWIDRQPKKLFLLGILLSLAILTAAIVSFAPSGAWLSDEVAAAFAPEYSNYRIDCEVRFLQADGSLVPPPADKDGLFQIEPVKDSAENYLEKLQINMVYEGKSQAYLRVRLIEEWYYLQDKTAYILPNTALISYTLGEGWVDNRRVDGYFYYKLPVGRTATGGEIASTDRTIQALITGIDKDGYLPDVEYRDKNLQMRLAVKAEAVQVNRFEQFWGFTPIW